VNDELALLRRFEPVVCYTRGEQFFPTAIDGYLRRASLWANDGGRQSRLVAEGELDAGGLARAAEAAPGRGLYLRFTDKPLDVAEYQRWRFDRPAFHAPGRLARVGLFARIVDSLFDVSLLVRGRVPGGATSIAAAKYREMHEEDRRYVYYGRVVRVGGYIVLNYWFFYAMNPWRSSFYGANDHEADWEQVFVYLSEEGDSEPVPRWAAFAQHDFAGDDLRRRWDDPELRRVGDHPVVFAGAGSHASYFEPGEYLMGVEPAALRPARNLVAQARRLWAERLGQGSLDSIDQEVSALFSVPFIDYARGDGLRIGPGQAQGWSPVLLTADAGWAERYRGLWGLDTRDPFGGERAPSGPKYNRDGSVRASWSDPLGWAGLDKVSPPSASQRQLEQAVEQLEHERAALGVEIEQRRSALRRLALQQQALDAVRGGGDRDGALALAERELHELAARDSDLDERLEASRAYLRQLAEGDPGDPQAHIRHRHRPEPPLAGRAWVIEVWGALSGAVLLASLGFLVVLSPAGWPLWVLLVLGASMVIDAAAQRQLTRLLLNATIGLAIVTALILAKDFWQAVIIVALLGFVVALVVQNLEELRRT
jgi:hypothetical protein